MLTSKAKPPIKPQPHVFFREFPVRNAQKNHVRFDFAPPRSYTIRGCATSIAGLAPICSAFCRSLFPYGKTAGYRAPDRSARLADAAAFVPSPHPVRTQTRNSARARRASAKRRAGRGRRADRRHARFRAGDSPRPRAGFPAIAVRCESARMPPAGNEMLQARQRQEIGFVIFLHTLPASVRRGHGARRCRTALRPTASP